MNTNFIEGIVNVNDLAALRRSISPLSIYFTVFYMQILKNTPQFTPWYCNEFTARQISVVVCRLDQLDMQLSGNKIYKLLANINVAKEQGFNTILSFGGMWSNHLYALAHAGKRYGLNTIGVVRGHEGQMTPMLADAIACGMTIHFVSPSEYKLKDSAQVRSNLTAKYGEFYAIPEGGANQLGVSGCQLIGKQIEQSVHSDAEYVSLAVGTGTTIAGLCCGLSTSKIVVGVVVLKGMTDLNSDIDQFIQQQNSESVAKLELEHDYHFGGYAKITTELAEFVTAFNRNNSFAIEPIYTGKAFFAIWDKIRSGKIPAGSKVVLLHTGGMQGARGTVDIVERLLIANVG
ncbi:MAG: 1-aminocyclopropane-1-carboxylate deaminase [Porticoccus sp.]|jgi:1-aminocyclopropane-1-carboxylate deaminase